MGNSPYLAGEGRRQHAELGAAYDEGRRRGDAQRRQAFGSWPSATWLPGVDVDHAVAVYGTLVSLESFDTAPREYGWTPDQVEAWWHETLVGQLLVASS